MRTTFRIGSCFTFGAACVATLVACGGATSASAHDGGRTVDALDAPTATIHAMTASAAFRDEDGYSWSVDYSVTLGEMQVDIANAAPGNALISFPDAVATATVSNTTDRHNLPPRGAHIGVYVPRSIPHEAGDCKNTLPRDVGCLLLEFKSDPADTSEIAVDGEATVTLRAGFGGNITVDDTTGSYSEVSEPFAVALGEPAVLDGVMLAAYEEADVDVSTCDGVTVWDTTWDDEQLCSPEHQAPPGGGSDSTVATEPSLATMPAPASGPPCPGGSERDLYEVVNGDFISRVAVKNGISIEELEAANVDNPAYQVFAPGQELWLPCEDEDPGSISASAGNSVDNTVATASCEIGQTLRRGDTGPQVQCLQVRLNEVNVSGEQFPVDGMFGGQTEVAVRAFQEANELGVDGVVGPATGELLGILAG